MIIIYIVNMILIKLLKDTSKEIELTNYIEEKDYDYF